MNYPHPGNTATPPSIFRMEDPDRLLLEPADAIIGIISGDRDDIEHGGNENVPLTIEANCIDEACAIVDDLIEQVALKDAPPANESSAFTNNLANHENNNTVRSRQCHGRGLDEYYYYQQNNNGVESPRDSLDSATTHSSRQAPSAFMRSYLKDAPLLPAAHRMGHAHLHAWSTWTLRNLRYDTVPLEVETNQLLSQTLTPLGTSASHQNQTGNHHNNTIRKPKKRLFWKRKKEPSPSSAAQLRLFGSEYARHLSNSALAPKAAANTNANSANSNVKQSSKTRKAKCDVLEEADADVLAGAILDICFTTGSEPPPKGFYRVTQTAHGHPFAISRRKKKMYLNVKKERNWNKAAQRPCVTSLTLIFPDRLEFVPPGFTLAKHGQEPANIGTDERIYLCFRRSREGNPFTGLVPLAPHWGESVPEGFAVVEQTPRNFPANLQGFFLAYRQRLASLEPLRPNPLVCSILERNSGNDDDDNNRKELAAYFATGGTIVSADVGQFHILDRSTHSLISPNSVISRLNMIESSRQKGNTMNSNNTNNNSAAVVKNNPTLSTEAPTTSETSVESNAKALRGEIAAQDSLLSEQPCTSFDSELLSLLARKPPRHQHHHQHHPSQQKQRAYDDPCLNFIPHVTVAGAGEVHAKAMEGLQARTTALLPILTACYSRHGGGPLLAVNGLIRLLNETNFFRDDIDQSNEPVDNESSTRITLLDIAVQAVCDVSTTGAEETTFASSAEFVNSAIQFSHGRLNTRTIGFVLRFYFFVFNFETSIPSRSTVWPNPSWSFQQNEVRSMLHDPRKEGPSCSYLPGGAPQLATLGLKDLISLSLLRAKKATDSERDLFKNNNDDDEDNIRSGSFIDGLVSSVDDDVESANLIQLALHQIHRSGGSELFWHDMIHVCGRGLFAKNSKLTEASKDICVMTFAILASIIKIAAGKLRVRKGTDRPIPRDRASKLLSLELLLHFLEYWSLEFEDAEETKEQQQQDPPKSAERIVYCIRRTVVPCLLHNTHASLEDPLVFSNVVRIITELWCSPFYRRRCKAEIGLLMEHFGINLLRLGPQIETSGSKGATKNMFSQQMELLWEVKTWFSQDPKDTIELFLNYDTDLSSHIQDSVQHLPGTRMNVFTKLCAEITGSAEQCGEVLSHKMDNRKLKIFSNSKSKLFSDRMFLSPNNHEWSKDSLDAAKQLRRSCLETLHQIVKALTISASAAAGNDYLLLVLTWNGTSRPVYYENTLSSSSESSHEDKSKSSDETKSEDNDIAASKSNDAVIKPSLSESLGIAADISEQKSLRKAIEYLIACKALTAKPRDIVTYLQVNQDEFSPDAIGAYLGEDGTTPFEVEYWKSVRYLYIRAESYIGMTVEEGLRRFLADSGFRLPGEAQKIDRIIGSFARCFFEDNAGDVRYCPFSSEDTVYVLCFAIIMLNTDLHKSVKHAKKSQGPMSKDDFIKNLKGVDGGTEIPKDSLSSIYDSIAARPIAVNNSIMGRPSREGRTSKRQILNNVRVVDSLLRGMAVHHFRFSTIENYTTSFSYDDAGKRAIHELTSSCVAGTWHQWYGLINTGFEMAYLEPHGMEPLLGILLNALTTTICLGFQTELMAFLDQLGRLKTYDGKGKWGIPKPSVSCRDETWYSQIADAAESGSQSLKKWALRKVHAEVEGLRPNLLLTIHKKAGMLEAVEQLQDAEYLYENQTRSFVKSGRVVKSSTRSRRSTACHIFLFSDILVYATENDTNRLEIKGQFQLHLIKLVDWFPPSKNDRASKFEVHHPSKSFTIFCASEQEKQDWVGTIRQAEQNLRAARPLVVTQRMQ